MEKTGTTATRAVDIKFLRDREEFYSDGRVSDIVDLMGISIVDSVTGNIILKLPPVYCTYEELILDIIKYIGHFSFNDISDDDDSSLDVPTGLA